MGERNERALNSVEDAIQHGKEVGELDLFQWAKANHYRLGYSAHESLYNVLTTADRKGLFEGIKIIRGRARERSYREGINAHTPQGLRVVQPVRLSDAYVEGMIRIIQSRPHDSEIAAAAGMLEELLALRKRFKQQVGGASQAPETAKALGSLSFG